MSATSTTQVPADWPVGTLQDESRQLVLSYSVPPSPTDFTPHGPPAFDDRTQVLELLAQEVKNSQVP